MRSMIVSLLVIVALLGSICETTSAGTLGKRYFSASMAFLFPEGESPEFGDRIGFGADLRLPIIEHLDLLVGASRTQYLGGSSTSLGGGLQCNLLPGKTINPVLIWNASWVRSEGRYGGSVNDLGIEIGGGAEISISESFSLGCIAEYVDLDGDNEVVAGIGFDNWFAERLLMSLGATIGFESKDAVLFFGIGLGSNQ